jgi:hypothetical protein
MPELREAIRRRLPRGVNPNRTGTKAAAHYRLDVPAGATRTRNAGFCGSGHHIQKLRNHRLGNSSSAAASGPRLATATRIRMSCGAAFAYSTNPSK